MPDIFTIVIDWLVSKGHHRNTVVNCSRQLPSTGIDGIFISLPGIPSISVWEDGDVWVWTTFTGRTRLQIAEPDFFDRFEKLIYGG